MNATVVSNVAVITEHERQSMAQALRGAIRRREEAIGKIYADARWLTDADRTSWAMGMADCEHDIALLQRLCVILTNADGVAFK